MKLNLCEIFKVEEKQHFWTKEHDDRIYEYFVSNNKLYIETKDLTTEMLCFNLMEVKEIYYTKPKQPIQLSENTKNFLKLIDKDYKYICRDEDGIMWVSQLKPEKVKESSIVCWNADGDFFELEENVFDIDLSFIKYEDEEPTLISSLIGDDE